MDSSADPKGPPMSAEQAVTLVLDAIFSQSDRFWHEIYLTVKALLDERRLPVGEPDYLQLHFNVAAISLNMRAAFDVFPRELAERIFGLHLAILHHHIPDPVAFHAVQNAILKYVEAYNQAILAIRNPAREMAHLLYYKMGFRNVEQKVVDESYFTAEPSVVDYLGNALGYFAGKWEAVSMRFSVE